jgi:hypothetical protein
MPDVYDELTAESERQYLEWSSLDEDDELRLEIQSDPVAGPEHPGGASDEATSEYSVLEMDAEVRSTSTDEIPPGEYRLSVSSSRLARALGEYGVQQGDTIILSWTPDGQYRDYQVAVL